MDLAQAAEFQLRLRHRHSDGSWSELERRPDHDPASHDPERDWTSGLSLYVCKACDEEVLVDTSNEAGTSGR
jgi:hypothetical protein